MSYLKRIIKVSGVDFHILYMLIMRMWAVLAGGVMVVGMPFWFTTTEQGYYFTFISLVALQIFFEMGLNFVISQFVGHEVAHLKLNEKKEFVGPSFNLDRLVSVVKLIKKVYPKMAVLYFLSVGIGGYYFFSHGQNVERVNWQVGWILLVLFSAVNLYLSPFLAVAEGAGFVGDVAKLRLFQSIGGYGLLWIALSFGVGLNVLFLLGMMNAIGTIFWFYGPGNFLYSLGRKEIKDETNSIRWKADIFPLQWRIAVSWISGYLIFQIFNPIIFSFQGAVEAGKAGLALTVFSTLLTVSMSLVNAKGPVFSGMIARNEHEDALKLFRGLLIRSAILNFFGCLGLLIGIYISRQMGFLIYERFPDFPSLICIALVTLGNQFIFSSAIFLRAHKKEPLLLLSVCIAFLTLASVMYGAQKSIFFVMFLYACVTTIIGVPWCYRILRKNI